MKKLFKLFLILILILAVGVGILFALDKIFNTNSFEDIQNAINSIIASGQPKEDVPVDTTPLKVDANTTSEVVLEPDTAVTVRTNKEVLVDDNNRTILTFVKKDFNQDTQSDEYWYALQIKNIGIGSATINVDIKDKGGNDEPITLKLNRQAVSLPFGMKTIDPWPNFKYTADGDDLKAQVNKEHKLINDYAPTDLKNLYSDYQLYTNTATIMLRKEAADYLSLMLSDLKKDTGKNAVIASGYRSYNEQYKLYADWVRQLGQDEADKVSARPGFSEHQLGTAVDFIDQESGLTLTNNFQKTKAGKWIFENSYKYGYIQSYLENKEEITGYSHEAWHYRYIGIDNATAVHDSGLTLKEWLEQNP